MKKYVLVLSLLFILTSQCFGWLSDYGYRKEITATDPNCDDNLTDFPFYFVITDDSDIGGNMENTTDFNDIRFTTSGDANFPVEKIYFDITGGVCNAVVIGKVNLSSAGTTFYCYYGKASDHSDWGTGDEIYDSNFIAVYHMEDDPDTSHIADATSNGYDGTKKGANEPNEHSAVITNGQDFDGTDDYISVSDNADLRFDTSDFTISTWFKRDTSDTYDVIISKLDDDDDGWKLDIAGTADTIKGSVDAIDVESDSTITDTSYHHACFVADRDGNGQIYLDGQADGSAVALNSEAMATTSAINIGRRTYDSIGQFDGILDEIHISNKIRSAAWIKMEYYNGLSTYGYEQNWGAEESYSPPSPGEWSVTFLGGAKSGGKDGGKSGGKQ